MLTALIVDLESLKRRKQPKKKPEASQAPSLLSTLDREPEVREPDGYTPEQLEERRQRVSRMLPKEVAKKTEKCVAAARLAPPRPLTRTRRFVDNPIRDKYMQKLQARLSKASTRSMASSTVLKLIPGAVSMLVRAPSPRGRTPSATLTPAVCCRTTVTTDAWSESCCGTRRHSTRTGRRPAPTAARPSRTGSRKRRRRRRRR